MTEREALIKIRDEIYPCICDYGEGYAGDALYKILDEVIGMERDDEMS